MSAFSEHADGLAEVAAELGSDCPVFTWDGDDYRCLPGGARFKRDNGVGGFEISSDLQLTCLTAPFGETLPDAGEPLVYLGRDYTIASVTVSPAGYQMRINADLEAKGM